MDCINYKPNKSVSNFYEDTYNINTNENDSTRNLVELVGCKGTDEEMNLLIDDNYENELVESMKTANIQEYRGKYKKYGEEQIAKLIKGCEDGLSIRKSAIESGVPPSSANILVKRYNKASNGILPTLSDKKPRSSIKLFPEHTAFLIDYFDDNPSATIEQAKNELCEKFKDFNISKSGLQKHIKDNCALTLNQTEKYTMDRDLIKTIRLRFDIITDWKRIGVDFMKNCVFIDEACFNSHMVRNRTWSKVDKPDVVKAPTQKGVNISIIGCISPFGTINFSKVESISQTEANILEQEYAEQNTHIKNEKKGNTEYHIVTFIHNVMDVLDKHDKKDHYILMDNCKVHHSKFVVEAIKSRGYKPLFIPPYSPFLNPIEECWSKIKKHIRRSPLSKEDPLTPRIAEACKMVSVKDCVDWISNSEQYWEKCLQKEVGIK